MALALAVEVSPRQCRLGLFIIHTRLCRLGPSKPTHMTREGHQDQFGLQRYGFVLEQVWKAFSPEKGQSADLPDHVAFKEILAGIFGGCTRSFDGKKQSSAWCGES